MGPLVEITLTSAGRRRFNSMAAAAFPAQPPQNQLGIVVDGTVQAAPAVMAPRIDGSIQVSGDFTASDARAIARAINASR
jgi:preprotein translocase subunit SecD